MASIFKHEPTGQTIRPGKSWRDENRTLQPGNWQIWNADYKSSMGIVEIVLESPPDSRFYTWSQNTDGTINSTAKSLTDIPLTDGTGEAIIGKDGNPELDINGQPRIDGTGDPILDGNGDQVTQPGVKSNLKQAVNSQQGSLLIQTDWMYIRKVDKAVEIPAHIQTYRNSVRVQGDAMKAAIDVATTTEEMVALFVESNRNEDGSVTKSGILYDWPELEE